MRSLFVDSSAWIALYDQSDQFHARIIDAWHELAKTPVSLVTTDYVLDEVYTHLRRRVGLPACVAFHAMVVSSAVLRNVEVTALIRQAGWEMLIRFDDRVLSFTDCTSFATMAYLEMRDVLTFDHDFRKAGFYMIPD